MKILICNAGSTSLKFKLWKMPQEEILAVGRVERIGMGGSIFAYSCTGKQADILETGLNIEGYTEGIQKFLHYLTAQDTGAIECIQEVECVGFKTVLSNGFPGAHLLTEEVQDGMRSAMDVAPAHNGPYLEAIQVFSKLLPETPLVGAFETAFHTTIPQYRQMYSLPWEWIQNYGIRKMGYHGASHSYVAMKTGNSGRVISCHLGGSSSLCSILDGKSIDNSFGLSLQTGIPHNNRVGDLDSYTLLYLQKCGLTLEELEKGLTKSAGLKGISGLSGDMRDIEEAMEQGNERAKLAFDMYTDAIRRYIGAYTVELGGLDRIVFTGGIGENSWRVRESVTSGLSCLGVRLDSLANKELHGEGCISTEDSKVMVQVIPANEELMVVRAAVRVLQESAIK